MRFGVDFFYWMDFSQIELIIVPSIARFRGTAIKSHKIPPGGIEIYSISVYNK